MEETEAVLARLARIEALDRAGSPPEALLDELRALVGEAERWAASEGVAEPASLGRCRDALARRRRGGAAALP
jgi:hypothetical protein